MLKVTSQEFVEPVRCAACCSTDVDPDLGFVWVGEDGSQRVWLLCPECDRTVVEPTFTRDGFLRYPVARRAA